MSCLDGRSAGLTWNYDRAEIIADGVVHAIGVSFGFVGAVSILLAASNSAQSHEVVPLLIYVAGLLAMLGLSAAYNMWPVSGAKWLLRRFDHSAIYVLIAGTYTPFLAQLKAGLTSSGLSIGIWSADAPDLDFMAHRGRRCTLFDRAPLSFVAEAALSERDLACLCGARRSVPLHRDRRLGEAATRLRALAGDP